MPQEAPTSALQSTTAARLPRAVCVPPGATAEPTALRSFEARDRVLRIRGVNMLNPACSGPNPLRSYCGTPKSAKLTPIRSGYVRAKDGVVEGVVCARDEQHVHYWHHRISLQAGRTPASRPPNGARIRPDSSSSLQRIPSARSKARRRGARPNFWTRFRRLSNTMARTCPSTPHDIPEPFRRERVDDS